MTEAPLPPQNLDAEESVLGAMMISVGACDAVADMLEGREFYRDTHGAIYRAIVSLHSRGHAVDAITVAEELGKTGAKIDGEQVHHLATLVPSAANARHYAGIVRDCWLARGLIRTGQEIAKLGWERDGEIEDLYRDADRRMVELQGFLERRNDSVYTGKQLAEDFLRRLNEPIALLKSVRSPFVFLPPLIGSRLYVLGGYQGDGKTALGMQFLRAGCESGARVGFMSIEMGRADMTDRLVSTFGVPYNQIVARQIEDSYQGRLNEALVSIAAWDWELIDDEEVDPAAVRRHQRRGRYDLLIIDHLHRMPVKDKRYERQELEDGVRRITNIAREFDVPVLLLSQLSRSNNPKEPFPRPTMADLRGSAMIEAEAAVVWFVWRKRDKQNQQTSDAELITAKNRFGAVGAHRLGFIGSQVRFTEQTS